MTDIPLNPGIMARRLIEAYPNNVSFHNHVWNFVGSECLDQLYHDICMKGGELIETNDQWNNVEEKMGWSSPYHCRVEGAKSTCRKT